jgi:tRNA (guanine37-N1)-methyltransferase
MKIDILTIFPQMFESYFSESILKRAQTVGLLHIKTHDLRKYSKNKHQKVDDRPFGGGAGMLMQIQPFFDALKKIRPRKTKKSRVIMLSAKGKTFSHADAVRLATNYNHLIFLCGRYEGIDERVADNLVDEEISIGNYVLTGGELPTMVITDAVARHIPGVLGDAESLNQESHTEEGLTEYPQYTRPESFIPNPKKPKKTWDVPPILLSGDHKKIAAWRAEQQKK